MDNELITFQVIPHMLARETFSNYTYPVFLYVCSAIYIGKGVIFTFLFCKRPLICSEVFGNLNV